MITRYLGRIGYEEALRMQTGILNAMAEAAFPEETLLLLEHDPVYTMGRHPDRSSLTASGALPHPVYDTNRGGQATWHGPGQLVGYPLIDLRRRGQDLHAYLRAIEEFLIRLLDAFGVKAGRRESMTGVWVEDRKIASIGVGVKRWISMHGFALNVSNELDAFSHIVPCGIEGVRMTSMKIESGLDGISVEEAARAAAGLFETVLEDVLPGIARRDG